MPAGTWRFPSLRQHLFVASVCPAPLESLCHHTSPSSLCCALPLCSHERAKQCKPGTQDLLELIKPFTTSLSAAAPALCNIIPVVLPISHLFAVPYVLSNLLSDFSSEVDLTMAAFLSPTLMHYFADSDSRPAGDWQHLWQGHKNVQLDLKGLAILFTVPM